jgi:p-hydroxybenzoate 3-monooxygenase
MRFPSVSLLYRQVDPNTDIGACRTTRLAGARATSDTARTDGSSSLRLIAKKSVLPMRNYGMTSMPHGRLVLAGDAVHTVPPTDAKRLNLAVARCPALTPALTALLRERTTSLADAYSDTAPRRVWRCTCFSWWMTTMLHTTGDPFDP